MLADAAAGAGLGLLIGFLIGLSSSPVVGTFVGSLTALLLALFTYRATPVTDGAASEEAAAEGRSVPGERRSANVRLAGFGFACVLGVVAGLWIRTHDALSPSLADRVAAGQPAWLAAGFPADEARRRAALQVLGAEPARDREAATAEDPAIILADRLQKSALMNRALGDGGTEGITGCEAIGGRQFASLRAALETMERQGGIWSDMRDVRAGDANGAGPIGRLVIRRRARSTATYLEAPLEA